MNLSDDIKNLLIQIEETQDHEEIRNFKKYSNRKIYDLKNHKYVTVYEIYDIFKNGENVKVISHKNNKGQNLDITYEVLISGQKEYLLKNKQGLDKLRKLSDNLV